MKGPLPPSRRPFAHLLRNVCFWIPWSKFTSSRGLLSISVLSWYCIHFTLLNHRIGRNITFWLFIYKSFTIENSILWLTNVFVLSEGDRNEAWILSSSRGYYTGQRGPLRVLHRCERLSCKLNVSPWREFQDQIYEIIADLFWIINRLIFVPILCFLFAYVIGSVKFLVCASCFPWPPNMVIAGCVSLQTGGRSRTST